MNKDFNKRGERTRAKMMKFIKEYFKKHGYAPSQDEIGVAVGLDSKGSVCQHMKILFAEKKIETDLKDSWHRSRAYRVAREK